MSSTLTSEELWERLQRFLQSRPPLPEGASDRDDWPDLFRSLRPVSCDGPSRRVRFSFRTRAWMSNVLGVAHGGVTATLLDSCMGVSTSVQAGGPTPTISMTINYARPVPLDAEIAVETRTAFLGGSIAHTTARVFLPDRPEADLVTATGVYSTAAGRRGA